MQPSIKQLKYIKAVAEHKHFGQAANACHVTQSTLSAGIQELERALGGAVFERVHKKILITEFGEQVLTRANKMLEIAEELSELSESKLTPLSGKLTLGAIPTIAPFLLPRALAVLRADYPDAKIFIQERKTEQLLDDLKTGKIDVALMALPYPIGDLCHMELFVEEFYLAFHPTSELCHRKNISIKDIEGLELLLLEEGHCLREHALSVCRLKGAKYGVPFQGTSLPTIVQMVANNLGATFLPDMAVKSGILDNTDIIVKPFLVREVSRSIGLVWRSTSGKQEDIQYLGEILRECKKV